MPEGKPREGDWSARSGMGPDSDAHEGLGRSATGPRERGPSTGQSDLSARPGKVGMGPDRDADEGHSGQNSCRLNNHDLGSTDDNSQGSALHIHRVQTLHNSLLSQSFTMRTNVLDSGVANTTKIFFGIGPQTLMMPASRLLYPLAPFSLAWTVLTALFLAYTAVVTPAVIAFFWKAPECSRPPPTIYFDVVVDCFFVLDILVSFSTGIRLHGRYNDHLRTVACHYTRHGLLFDVFTSIPVSFMELADWQACQRAMAKGQEGVEKLPGSTLRMIRFMKPFRWFKIARILKMSRMKDIFIVVEDQLGIPPRVMRLVGVVTSVCMGIHVSACFFWLVRVNTMSEQDVEDFILGSVGADVDPHSPNGMVRIYTMCFYFVSTVFTTVGFGDIAANNSSEQIFIVCLMLLGSLVFATLLSEIQEMHQQAERMQLAKSDRLQLSCDVLQALEVPDELHKEIIGWTRFSFERNQRTEDLKRVVMDLPPILKSRLMQFLYADSLVSVGVVGFITSIDPSFLMQLWHDVEHVPFYKGEALVHWHEKANRCIIVTEGILEVHVDRDELPQISKSEARRAADGSTLASRLEGDAVLKLQLRKGDFVGELALLGDTDWGASSSIAFPGTDVRISAAGNAMCMIIPYEGFQRHVQTRSAFIRQKVAAYAQSRMNQSVRSSYGRARSMDVSIRWLVISGKLISARKASTMGDQIAEAFFLAAAITKRQNKPYASSVSDSLTVSCPPTPATIGGRNSINSILQAPAVPAFGRPEEAAADGERSAGREAGAGAEAEHGALKGACTCQSLAKEVQYIGAHVRSLGADMSDLQASVQALTCLIQAQTAAGGSTRGIVPFSSEAPSSPKPAASPSSVLDFLQGGRGARREEVGNGLRQTADDEAREKRTSVETRETREMRETRWSLRAGGSGTAAGEGRTADRDCGSLMWSPIVQGNRQTADSRGQGVFGTLDRCDSETGFTV